MTRKELGLLAILASVQFCNIMDFMVVQPLGPVLMRIFHIGTNEFGWIVSSYAFTAGLSGFIGAFFIDRFDRKKTLVFCFTGFTIGTFACAAAPTYELLVLARVLTGMFGGLLGSTVLSIVGDSIPEARRATALGIVMMAFSMASILGVPFGLYLAVRFSWHAPFLLLGGIGTLLLLLMIVRLPSFRAHLLAKRVHITPLHVLGNIARNHDQRLALLLMFCMVMSQFSIVTFLSPYFVGNVGFSETDLTYIYLTGGLASLIVSPLFGRLSDKYGKKRMFYILATCSIGPSLLLTHLGPQPLWVALVATTSFFIFNGGRMVPSTAITSSTVLPANRGSFLSFNGSVQQIASALAISVAGAIVYRTPSGEIREYEWVGWLSVVATVIAIFVAGAIRPASVQVPAAAEAPATEKIPV
jgi:MFS transporter, DHA1 family, inner membrane transport protein